MTIAQGIVYAVDQGADIINCSFGFRNDDEFYFRPKLVAEALQYAHQNGVLCVVAAGNVNEHISRHTPARVVTALTVGATTQHDEKTDFSNFGVDLSAPGGGYVNESWSGFADSYNILSVVGEHSTMSKVSPHLNVAPGYHRLAGTSLACAYVSGVAALVKSKLPDLSAVNLADLLKRTTRPETQDSNLGAGIVNAKLAVVNTTPQFSPSFKPSYLYGSGQTVFFHIKGFDYENDPLTYGIIDPPPQSVFVARVLDEQRNANGALFAWDTSNFTPPGSVYIVFTVSDGNSTHAEEIRIDVSGYRFYTKPILKNFSIPENPLPLNTQVSASASFYFSYFPYYENIPKAFWFFGDGVIQEGFTCNHTYAKPGTYQAYLLCIGINLTSSIYHREVTVG